MYYISKIENLAIRNRNGAVAYQFKNHRLLVGSATTDVGAGNKIDATLKAADTDNELQRLTRYPTDLLGAVTNCVEMAGQGSLVRLSDGGTALSALICGYTGLFFKAPTISGGTAVPAIAGITYRVEAGTVTYNSIAYGATTTFVTDGTATATSGSGAKFRVWIPKSLDDSNEEQYLTESFKIAQLETGLESPNYFNYNIGGAAPYSSMTSSATNFYGKTQL